MPKNTKKKTRSVEDIQRGAMWALVRKNMSDSDFREWIFDLTNDKSESSSDLTFEQKNHVIEKLGGRPFTKPTKSRRTENHNKQKAGIDTLVTPTYMDAMRKRWREIPGRTDEGLEALCLRTIKAAKPRTMKECQKMIEAIKSMNLRAKLKLRQEAKAA